MIFKELIQSDDLIHSNRVSFKKLILVFLVLFSFLISIVLPLMLTLMLYFNKELFLSSVGISGWGPLYVAVSIVFSLLFAGTILPASLWKLVRTKNKYLVLLLTELSFWLLHFLAVASFIYLPNLKFTSHKPNFEKYFSNSFFSKEALMRIINEGDAMLSRDTASDIKPNSKSYNHLEINYIPEGVDFYRSGVLDVEDNNIGRYVDYYNCKEPDILVVYQYLYPKSPAMIESYYSAEDKFVISEAEIFNNPAILLHIKSEDNYHLYANRNKQLLEVVADKSCLQDKDILSEMTRIIESVY